MRNRGGGCEGVRNRGGCEGVRSRRGGSEE